MLRAWAASAWLPAQRASRAASAVLSQAMARCQAKHCAAGASQKQTGSAGTNCDDASDRPARCPSGLGSKQERDAPWRVCAKVFVPPPRPWASRAATIQGSIPLHPVRSLEVGMTQAHLGAPASMVR